MSTAPNWKKIGVYQLIATSLSTVSSLIIKQNEWKFFSMKGVITLSITMYIPTISVFIVEKLLYEKEKQNTIKKYFNVKSIKKVFANKMALLTAWTLPVIYNLLSIPVCSMLYKDKVKLITDRNYVGELLIKNGIDVNSDMYKIQMDSINNLPFHPFWWSLIQSLIIPQLVNPIFAIGEEIGWRSFLYNELRFKIGFWKYSIVSGILWGLWHAPIILTGYNYPSNPKMGVLYMTLFCSLLSPVMTALTDTINESNNIGNPWLAAMFHGVINGSAGLSNLVLKGGNSFINPPLGISSFVVYGIGCVGLYFLRRDKKGE